MGRTLFWSGVLIVAAPAASGARPQTLAPGLILNPTSALPGKTVAVSGEGDEIESPGGTCTIYVGQALAPAQSCIFNSTGGFGGGFTVPDSLVPAFYPVSVCWPDCSFGQGGAAPGSWQVEQDLEVLQGVSVPPVRCETEDQALGDLRQAQLNAKPLFGDTGVVIGQFPSPGDIVPVGDTVFYTLQTRGATLFPVPPLRGMSLQAAGERLAATCLALVISSGERGTSVTFQTPEAGTQVPASTEVTVAAALPSTPPTTRLTTPPTTAPTTLPTTVPTSSPTNRRATGGVVVGPGSNGFPPDSPGLVVLLVVLLAVLAVITGWWAYLRPRLQARWVQHHVTTWPLTTSLPVVVHTLTEPGTRDHRFSWLARRDAGSSTIEEDPT